MKKVIALLLVAVVTICVYGRGTVSKIGEPVSAVSEIVDGGKYMLHNTGRDRWVNEDGYAALKFSGKPVEGPDRSNDFVFTFRRDDNGYFTVETRRGRYIPEVDENTPLTVGSAARAGHFNITPSGVGKFTIVNTVDTRYGFDGTESNFIGWNAAEGLNCKYEIIPVEFSEGHYPLDVYTEPSGSEPQDMAAWLQLDDEVYFTWASRDVQYARNEVPAVRLASDTTFNAWKGERLGVQAIVFARKGMDGLSVSIGAWRDADSREVVSFGNAAWTRYVITDENVSCGDHQALPIRTVPDVIDLEGTVAGIEDYGVRPIWCAIEVPSDIPAGKYTADLHLCKDMEVIGTLTLNVNVIERTMPAVESWAFHLDFWQQPYAVSRYYDVERWSNDHFDALRPYMKALGRAGQKVVTAILFHEPWGRQSYDKFDPMVETTLKADGNWAFDYTIFDRWVEFMDGCGINTQINCYSMVPWDMKFRYLDEATDTYRYLSTQTSTEEYSKLWTAFLTDFASHLKEKGWFEKTAIGMDERGLGAMRDAIAIVNRAAPGLKISLAGNYHSEISADLYDYSIAYSQKFPADELTRRREAGQKSTSYVCCADPGANIFTNKPLSDAAYLPVQAVAAGLDGILHWSWINWPENPLIDSRLQLPDVEGYTFAPGDTYSYYPGPRSSVRFERLIEGIQQTEKIRVLREQWEADGNTEKLNELNKKLAPFVSGKTDAVNSSAKMVTELEDFLNGVSDGEQSALNEPVTVEATWSGDTLMLGCEATVSVYALNGALLHNA